MIKIAFLFFVLALCALAVLIQIFEISADRAFVAFFVILIAYGAVVLFAG